MTPRIRWTLLLTVFVAWASLAAAAQETGVLNDVRTTSESLTTYCATIEMTQHQARGDSVIVFAFDFAPTDRMRIAYTSPASVDGQMMILNGARFYTYIPSLNRQLWQDVEDGGNDQGEEMGFLYDFVTRSAGAFIDASVVEVAETPESYILDAAEQEIAVTELLFQTPDGRQMVKVNRADAAPVAIDIYDGDDLIMEIRVLSYILNEELDEALFAIPEK